MIWLEPAQATFAGEELGGVTSITLDRKADRLLVEYGDRGPHPAFADVPEQRSVLKVVRTVEADDPGSGLTPGASGLVSFVTAPDRTGVRGERVAMESGVVHVMHAARGARGVGQTIEFVGVSALGTDDPVVRTPAG